MRHVLVDIGNSAVKCAISDKTRWPTEEGISMSPMVWEGNESFVTDPSSLFARNDWFDALSAEGSNDVVTEWLICSVNQSVKQKAIASIESSSPNDKVRVITWEDLPVSLAVKHPDRVGMDRICAAVGARDLCDSLPGSPRDAIVVDAGTAVTIDLIDKDRTFLGGVIFPGLSLSFKSLHKNTSQLPEIGFESPGNLDSVIGKSTNEAIRNGVMLSHVGAISFIIEKMRSERNGDVEVFVTGGDADLFVSQMPDCRHVESLVLRGLATAMDQSR